MASYYVLSPDPNPVYMRIKESRLPKRYSDSILFGKSIKPAGQPPVLYLEKKTAKPVDLVGGMITVPIVSERMRTAIQQLPDPSEFYPVRLVLPKDPKVEYRYFAFNALDNVDAFDRTKSKYTAVDYSPVVPHVTKLAIIESKVGGRHIFRLTTYPLLLIVSQQARQTFEAASLVGLQFTAVADYKP
jgi:hypothetical protein